jgi:hypothetical protein
VKEGVERECRMKRDHGAGKEVARMEASLKFKTGRSKLQLILITR